MASRDRHGTHKALLNASYYYNSGYFAEVDNVLRQPAFSLLNTSVRFTSANEKFWRYYTSHTQQEWCSA